MKAIKSIPALPVKNIKSGVEFYVSRYDFNCLYQNEGFAKLLWDEVEIHLWVACDNSWKWRSFLLFLRPIYSGAETFIAGTHSCRIQVTDIHSLFEKLKAKGVLYSSSTVVESTDWGTLEFPTLDLHCNLITFFERIKD